MIFRAFKYGIIFLLALFYISVNAQNHADSLCRKYGHVVGKSFTINKYSCPSYTMDSGGITWKVIAGCNNIVFKCLRCASFVTQLESERKIALKANSFVRKKLAVKAAMLSIENFERNPLLEQDMVTSSIGYQVGISALEFFASALYPNYSYRIGSDYGIGGPYYPASYQQTPNPQFQYYHSIIEKEEK